ncbi:MAG: nuclear transport factor 2 family protein [Alphaproteobacteria bacterium]|nr:nuclear transport factor 2 family protein [Alphaproteobacteria bacterium]
MDPALANGEAAVARLEAIEDIKQLKARYCAFCDVPFDGDRIAPLFVPEGVWEAGDRRVAGREAIRTFFNAAKPLFIAHLVTNPIITVDGDRATGHWWVICPSTRLEQGRKVAYWILGYYDDVYVRQTGCWLFEHVRTDVKFWAPHHEGWVADMDKRAAH